MTDLDTTEATVEEAEEITNLLRQAIGMTFQLVYEAHERKVWKALGYSSWGDYTRERLDMSRSRSYQLLRQAGLVHGAVEALSVSTNVDTDDIARALPEGLVRQIAGFEPALQIRLHWWPHLESETDREFTSRIARQLRDDITDAAARLEWLKAELDKSRTETELAEHAAFERQVEVWAAGVIVAAGGDEADWRTFLETYKVPEPTTTDMVRWQTLAGMDKPQQEKYLGSLAFVGAEPHG